MGSLLFSWGVVATVVPTLLALGWVAMGLNQPLLAQISFSVASLIFITKFIWWISLEHPFNASKIQIFLVIFIAVGIVGILWVYSLKWVNGLKPTLMQPSATAPINSKQKPKMPPSLHELYKSDFPTTMRPSYDFDVSFKDGTKVRVSATEYLDFSGRSKFMGFYIPQSLNTYDVCVAIADNYKTNMNYLESSGTIRAWISGESAQTSSHDLIFSGRIYIYHDDFMTLQQLAKLESLYQSKGLSVVFRSDAYMQSQWNK